MTQIGHAISGKIAINVLLCIKYKRMLIDDTIMDAIRTTERELLKEKGIKIVTEKLSDSCIKLTILLNPYITINDTIRAYKKKISKIVKSKRKDIETKLPTLWCKLFFVWKGKTPNREIDRFLQAIPTSQRQSQTEKWEKYTKELNDE